MMDAIGSIWMPINLTSKETWILVVSLLFLVRYYLHQKWKYFDSLGIPYDPPMLRNLGNMRRFFKEGFMYELKMKKKFGPVWGFFEGGNPGIVVQDPDMLRKIFITEFKSFTGRSDVLRNLVADIRAGLTAAEGQNWKRSRATITPAFSTSKLRQMMYIMDRCIDNMAKAFDRRIHSSSGVFNCMTLFSRLTLDIICSAAFSTDVNSLDDSSKEPEMSRQAKKLLSGSIFSPLIVLVTIFPCLGKITRALNLSIFPRSSMNYFRGVAEYFIDQRLKSPHELHERVDLMQYMIDHEISDKEAAANAHDRGLTKDEIVANSILGLVAGHENAANIMAFLAYRLALNPSIQSKLQDEVDEVYQTHGKLGYELVNRLEYMDMCMNETLRMYMPVVRNFRTCEKETTIDGITFPKGIKVTIPAYAMAHDPDYWDNPFDFNPERMRDMSKIDPMVFMPFGAGPRNCIGLRFAQLEIKMCMAKILRDFSFQLAPNTPKPPLKLSITITIRGPAEVNLKVERRKVFT